MRLIEEIQRNQLGFFSVGSWAGTVDKLSAFILKDSNIKNPENRMVIAHDNDCIFEKLSEFAVRNGLEIQQTIFGDYRTAIISWGSPRTNSVSSIDYYINATGTIEE